MFIKLLSSILPLAAATSTQLNPVCRDLFTNLDKDKSNSISSEEMVDGLRSQVSWFCRSWWLHDPSSLEGSRCPQWCPQ